MEDMETGIKLDIEDFYNPIGFQVSYLNQKPHKKQQEVLLSKNKHKIIVCGRRSGKTQMVAGEIIRGAVLKLYEKQMVVAPTYKQTMIVFYKITELMEKAGVYEDIENVILSPRPKIVFRNGSFVDFGSADNPNSLRGEAYDRMFKDESSFIKKGANNALRPLTYDVGGPVWETTTPWGKGEVWELWSRGLRGDEDYGCFHYNYKHNPYLSEEGVKEIEKDIKEYGEGSVYVQCEVYGNFVEDRDTYFSSELIKNCISDDIPLESLHPNSIYVLGIDVAGMGQDETVLITVEETSKRERRVNFIDNYERNKPREIVGKAKLLDEKYNYVRIYLDMTGIGEGPVDWLKESLSEDRVVGMRFTVKSKEDMYSNLKKLMEQGFKIPNHKKLIYQLMDLRYEVTSSGNLKIHHSEGKFDDYADALALACWYFKDDVIGEYEPFIF